MLVLREMRQDIQVSRATAKSRLFIHSGRLDFFIYKILSNLNEK